MRSNVWMVAAVLAFSLGAAEKVKTVPEMIKDFATAVSKDSKKVKSKETFVTAHEFADRTLDALESAGLQGNATTFKTLSAELQTALTRLKDDMNQIKNKHGDFKKNLTDTVKELREAQLLAIPPSIEAGQELLFLLYAGANDGLYDEKEKLKITEAQTVVLATSGLPPANATAIQTALTTLLASTGVGEAELLLVKNDLAALLLLVK